MISLLKFGICFITTNIAEIKDRIKTEVLSRKRRRMKRGREMAAVVELTEMYLVRSKTIQNMLPAPNVGTGANPKKTPQVVRTPFPPFPFRKIDQLWPQIAENPAEIATHSDRPRYRAKKGKRKPFPISKINVGRPYFQPAVLKTLVNPIFPEPTLLMSIPFNLTRR